KNQSNPRNSQVCAFALLLILVTALPAAAVSQRVADGYGTPGFSVLFSSPAGAGGISNSTGYMTINPFNVYAVLPNGDKNWSSLQQLKIDWTIYRYDSARQTWY